MKKIIVLLSLMFAFNCMQAQQPQGMVTLLGYLHVYPEDLGDFTYEPVNIINAINSQAKYGYDDWRLPTVEEIELMIANKSKIPAFQEGKFMTKDGKLRSGNVRLVTTGKTVAEKDKQRKIEETKRSEQKRIADKAAEERRIVEAKAKKMEEMGAVSINGVWWATRNVGSHGTFVPKPEDYGGYYTWDEAQTVCPAGWRLPTKQELQSLINSGNNWIIVNSTKGRIFGPGNTTVFLPAAGMMTGIAPNMAVQYQNFAAFYWSSAPLSGEVHYGMMFGDDQCDPYPSRPTSPCSVRCVCSHACK